MSTDTALDTLPLADFVAQGWEKHPEQPQTVAAGLQARAATLPADGEGAAALQLAEHVWLSHLNDRAGLEAFLHALPPGMAQAEAPAAAMQRARWVLAMLAGQAPPPLADALRWRGVQNLCMVWVADGRAADAEALLRAEVPKALDHPDSAARRALAASCNNLAADLREGRRGEAAIDALMLTAAEASAQLWRTAGTWVNAERAEYQWARCHAVLGQGGDALRHARACLAAIEAHADQPEADAFERFFAHEALAWAQLAAGDGAAWAAERQRMLALRAEVADPSLQPWCDKALAALDTGAARR